MSNTERVPTPNKWKEHVQRLMAGGASYADVRYYSEDLSGNISLHNGNLVNPYSGGSGIAQQSESGYGVRCLYGGAWGFAASSDPAQITATFDRALDNAKSAAARVSFPIRLADKEVLSGEFVSPCARDPFDVPIAEQIAFLNGLDAVLNQTGVAQRTIRLSATRTKIEYYDSEGAEIRKQIINFFPSMTVMGRGTSGDMQRRTYKPPRLGESRGWEIMNPKHWHAEGERLVRELNELLVAPACPVDTRSVIIMPDMMFLQVHETIGHALELDRILGYELSFAGGSFVRLEDFGNLQYGSARLTARADATVPNSPGSFGYDDDGVAAQNRLLIDRGTLVGAISSRQTVTEANAKAGRDIFAGSGGANRACAFNRTPIERMTNINIDPGNDGNLDDIIADTERGIIVSGDRSWSIGSNREQFHFATEIGWLVEDGKRCGIVRNPSYQGMTLDFYRSLTAVGDASTWEVHYVPNCGKGAPGQIMQLGHGIPVCRFDNLKVGE
ncbi:MAG: TldD/PmbA family protein [Clostridiaceae bacterium]|nr:TldD/PmbA family protein [Clostridiaceae bacterium]